MSWCRVERGAALGEGGTRHEVSLFASSLFSFGASYNFYLYKELCGFWEKNHIL